MLILEWQRKFVTQIHADLVFQACITLLRCFRTPVAPIRKILVHIGMLPCLVPSWPQIMQIRISFRSRSNLVLDADHSLEFLSYLVLQACISFCSVSDKSGASLFLFCSHKNVAARVFCKDCSHWGNVNNVSTVIFGGNHVCTWKDLMLINGSPQN